MAKELGPDPGLQFTQGSERAGKEWVTELIALTRQVAAIADLNLTVSNPPTQAEGQAIADKIDEILAAMRTAGSLESN